MTTKYDYAISPENLMRQASGTAHDYLVDAVDNVERVMGEGAAEKYPQIVAALVTATAQDYHTGMLLSYVTPRLCEALRTDQPLQGETLQGVASALGDVADAIRTKE